MPTDIMPRTPEWLEARKRHITATDVARIMEGQGFTVYHEKIGTVEPFAGNEITEIGNELEAPILRIYARRRQCELVYPVPLTIDPTCPALAATPDAMWQDRSTLVEAKTSASPTIAHQLGEEESDSLPEKWIWQGQSQMACTGIGLVEFPVLLFGRLKIYRLERNETLIAKCRATATEYADRVARRLEPPLVPKAAANQATIKALYGPTAGVTIDLSDEAAALWAKKQEASAIMNAAKKDADTYDAAMRAVFKDAEIGVLPDGGTLRMGTVNCEERIQQAYAYTRFWYKKPSKTKGK